jgi:hypothetical protein
VGENAEAVRGVGDNHCVTVGDAQVVLDVRKILREGYLSCFEEPGPAIAAKDGPYI